MVRVALDQLVLNKFMNKEQIINIINEYQLDKSKFIVISGAALVLLDIKKKANDIDICCGIDYYNYLLREYPCELERINEFGEKAYMINGIINFGTSFCPQTIEIIEGIRCSSLKDIIELKKFLNRDKDKLLIKKLEKILKRGVK